jgi:hypothetical protein
MAQVSLDLAAVYRPYAKQAEFLASTARNRFFLAGRGAGKSWTLTLDALLQALANPGLPGALLGRTERDLKRNLLPFLRDHLRTLRDATGVNWVRRWSGDEQAIHLINGSTIYWQGYERVDKLRGANFAWINADEVCWSEADELTIWETLTPSIRLPCARPSFAVASSPNGLRGITKLFRDRQVAGDASFQAFRATSYANPHLSRDVIDAMIAGMSARRVDQEIYAIALRPQSAVFAEFREARHVVRWKASQHRECRWVFGVDWGLSRAAAVAIQVTPDGRWVVVDELLDEPTSRGHWRAKVKAWIDDLCDGADPFLIASDRAVPSENAWVRGTWGLRRVHCLAMSSKHDQYVRTGLAMIGDLLAPVVGPERLIFADTLSRESDDVVAGVLPAMQNYRFKVDAEGNPTDEPLKDNVHDHVLDGLRYAVVAGSRFKELHAGRLPNRLGLAPDGLSVDGADGSRPHY